MKWLLVGLAALLLCGAIAAVGAWHVISQNLEPVAESAEPVIFSVQAGETLKTVASRLETEGLVRNRHAVEWFGRYHELSNKLRTGEYWVSATETPGEILATLTTGQVATYELVIPEGFTAAMIAQRIEAAELGNAEEFLAWVRSPTSAEAHGVVGATLEGYLFPETYRLPKGLSTRETAAVLVNQFLAVWQELEPRAREQKLSMKDLVTLASIIEKETVSPKSGADRSRVPEPDAARHATRNRSDRESTASRTSTATCAGATSRTPTTRTTPTRSRACLPDRSRTRAAAALDAVLAPASVDYLFFVSKNDGTTYSRIPTPSTRAESTTTSGEGGRSERRIRERPADLLQRDDPGRLQSRPR